MAGASFRSLGGDVIARLPLEEVAVDPLRLHRRIQDHGAASGAELPGDSYAIRAAGDPDEFLVLRGDTAACEWALEIEDGSEATPRPRLFVGGGDDRPAIETPATLATAQQLEAMRPACTGGQLPTDAAGFQASVLRLSRLVRDAASALVAGERRFGEEEATLSVRAGAGRAAVRLTLTVAWFPRARREEEALATIRFSASLAGRLDVRAERAERFEGDPAQVWPGLRVHPGDVPHIRAVFRGLAKAPVLAGQLLVKQNSAYGRERRSPARLLLRQQPGRLSRADDAAGAPVRRFLEDRGMSALPPPPSLTRRRSRSPRPSFFGAAPLRPPPAACGALEVRVGEWPAPSFVVGGGDGAPGGLRPGDCEAAAEAGLWLVMYFLASVVRDAAAALPRLPEGAWFQAGLGMVRPVTMLMAVRTEPRDESANAWFVDTSNSEAQGSPDRITSPDLGELPEVAVRSPQAAQLQGMAAKFLHHPCSLTLELRDVPGGAAAASRLPLELHLFGGRLRLTGRQGTYRPPAELALSLLPPAGGQRKRATSPASRPPFLQGWLASQCKRRRRGE
jgi:hypothetical protein